MLCRPHSGTDLYSNNLTITQNCDGIAVFLNDSLQTYHFSFLLLPHACDTNHSKEVRLVLDAMKTAVEDSKSNMQKLKHRSDTEF